MATKEYEEFIYRNNPNLLNDKVQHKLTKHQISEIVKCSKDPIYFMETYCVVIDPDEGKVVIKLRDYQKDEMIPNFHDNRFSISLLARQSGKSLIAALYITWYTIFHNDKASAILANKERIATKQLARVKLAYERVPVWLKPGVKSWGQTGVEFANGSSIESMGTASDAARGLTINGILILDEFGFVPTNIQDEFISSVYPTVTSSKKSKIIIISTLPVVKSRFELEANKFWTFYNGAQRGFNNYSWIAIDYKAAHPPELEPNFKEETIMGMGGDASAKLKFEVEFANKVVFSTERKYINPSIMAALYNRVEDPIDTPAVFEENGKIFTCEVWEFYREEGYYVAGVDSGKGIGADYSVINVFRFDPRTDTYTQVCRFSSNTIAVRHEYPKVILNICKMYNDDISLCIESNDIGFSVITQVDEEIMYSGRAIELVALGNSKASEVGVRQTTKVRSFIMLTVKALLEQTSQFILKSKDTVEQYDTIFENKAGKFVGTPWDDDVMSCNLVACVEHPLLSEEFKSVAEDKFNNPGGEKGDVLFESQDLCSILF